MNPRPRTFFQALRVAPLALLALSCMALAEPGAAPGGAKPQAAASAPDLSGVWMGDGAGNNRALLATGHAADATVGERAPNSTLKA